MKRLLASLLISLVTVTSVPEAAVSVLNVQAAENQKDISLKNASIVIDNAREFVYDGKPKEPAVSVKLGGNTVPSSSYTVQYSDNVNASTKNSTAKVTVTAKAGSGYTDSKTLEFTIKKATPVITVNDSSDKTYTAEYTGSPITIPYTVDPENLQSSAVVTYGSGSDKNLPKTNVGSYGTTITVPSTDNYNQAAWSGTLKIQQKDISAATVTTTSKSYSYTGKAITPEVTVQVLVNGETKTLNPKTDYSVQYQNNTSVSTKNSPAYVVVTGKGNYTGNAGCSFTIEKADIAKTDIGKAEIKDIPDQGYTGSAVTPSVTVTIKSFDGKVKTLRNGTDYKVEYSSNYNVGTATVTVTGQGDYSGTITKTFEIKAIALKDSYVSNVADQNFTGSAIEPNVTIRYNGKTLIKERDYKLSYSNNVNVTNLAKIEITGQGIYTGTIEKTFKIKAHKLTEDEISGIDDSYDYTGKPITPEPIIEVGRIVSPLKKGEDYTVSYSSNTNPGTAKVVITGKGNFTGTVTKTFTISEPAGDISISGAVISDIKDVTYSGKEYKPSVTVKLNGVVLRSGTDYQVSYYNNTNAGTATLSIKGIRKYRDTVTKTFKIKPVQISSVSIASIPAQKYTGFAVKPDLTLTYGGMTLEEGRDYNVTYAENRQVGTAKATINGLGNYEGYVVKTFTISENAEPTPVPTDSQFTDVTNKNSYYYDAVYALYDEGVVAGTTKTTFAPLKNVTRAEFVQMLYNKAVALYRDGKTSTNPASVRTTSKFDDVSSGKWYAKAVSWAVANGITAGKTDYEFAPDDIVTRAESVQFLKNMVAPNQSASGKTSFTDVPEDKWYAKAVSWAVSEGVASGRTSTIFAPEATTVRADAAVLINNAKDLF